MSDCSSDDSIGSASIRDTPENSNGVRRRFLNDKEAALVCKDHFSASTMDKEIKCYVRNSLFRISKFPPCDDYCRKMVLHTRKQFQVTLPPDVSASFFAAYWSSSLKKNITACRHNAQTLARKNFLGKFTSCYDIIGTNSTNISFADIVFVSRDYHQRTRERMVCHHFSRLRISSWKMLMATL